MSIPMWRRGQTPSTVFSRSADPTPSTYRGTAAWGMLISSAANRIGSEGTAQGRDDIVEHRDGELRQRRVDLAEAGLKRGVDRRRITGQQSLVDVVAGELRRLDQVAEVDEQLGAQTRILRYVDPVIADQRPVPRTAVDDDLARVGQEPFGLLHLLQEHGEVGVVHVHQRPDSDRAFAGERDVVRGAASARGGAVDVLYSSAEVLVERHPVDAGVAHVRYQDIPERPGKRAE